MSLSVKCLCGARAFPTRQAAERHLARVLDRGLRREAPSGVVECSQKQWHLADAMPSAALARVVELKPVSAKRAAENKLRREVAHATFGRNPPCSKPGCDQPADDCHEPLTRGRGGSITDADNMVPLCRPHHDAVHLGPDWAYEAGLMRHSWPEGAA